jgi:putative transcriptional regulator
VGVHVELPENPWIEQELLGQANPVDGQVNYRYVIYKSLKGIYTLQNAIYVLQYCSGWNKRGQMQDIEIANKVKLARVEKDFTQEQLADLVGVTRQTIGLIEAGKYNPTLKLCLMLAKVTGKSLDDLFWIEGERQR